MATQRSVLARFVLILSTTVSIPQPMDSLRCTVEQQQILRSCSCHQSKEFQSLCSAPVSDEEAHVVTDKGTALCQSKQPYRKAFAVLKLVMAMLVGRLRRVKFHVLKMSIIFICVSLIGKRHVFLFCVRKEAKKCRIMERKEAFSVMYLLLLNLVGWHLCGTSTVILFYMLMSNHILCFVALIG